MWHKCSISSSNCAWHRSHSKSAIFFTCCKFFVLTPVKELDAINSDSINEEELSTGDDGLVILVGLTGACNLSCGFRDFVFPDCTSTCFNRCLHWKYKKKMHNEEQMKEGVTVMFNATFNNISVISWRSVLLVEETGVPGENHWPAFSH